VSNEETHILNSSIMGSKWILGHYWDFQTHFITLRESPKICRELTFFSFEKSKSNLRDINFAKLFVPGPNPIFSL